MGYHHAELLYQLGIFVVRHRDPRVRLAYPERMNSGVYRIVESMNLRLARFYDYPDKAKIFINEAVARGAAYHLWFHPSDDRRVFEEAFLPIMEFIDSCRQRGLLWVATMSDLAAYCEARERTSVFSEPIQNGLLLSLQCSVDTARYGNPELTLEVDVCCPAFSVSLKNGACSEKVEFRMIDLRSGENRLFMNIPCQSKQIEIRFS
jgi:hypothetical protein